MTDPISTLHANPLFQNLSKEQIEHLVSMSGEITLQPGDYLVKEGDKADNVCIILDGNLEILKWDSQRGQEFSVGSLKGGDTVGELALADPAPRSASLKATVSTHLKCFPIDVLEQAVKKDPSLLTIYRNLSQDISKKLRQTTEITVEALKNQLLELKNRTEMGLFLISIIVILSLISFSIIPLQEALKYSTSSTAISVPFILSLTLVVLGAMKLSNLPANTFGLTLKNMKRSIFEGVVFSIPYGLGVMLLKIAFILWIPSYQRHQLFEPFALVPEVEYHTLNHWLFLNFLYVLFVPAQELLARGALQGPMEKFLTGKWKAPLSILASNLIFSTAHIYLSVWIAFIAFAGGLFQGWLFSRTHNLVGVTISHSLLGIWALAVLGP